MRGKDGDIVILASCEYYYITINENLVQHPSDNIWITSSVNITILTIPNNIFIFNRKV